MVSIELVFNQLITGLSIGGRLFLIAVGLSLIFGVLDVLNFAHGVLYMIGAYGSLWALGVVSLPLVGTLNVGFWPGLVVAVVGAGLVGVFIETGFLRRVYDGEEVDHLLLTFAFVLMLTDIVRTSFGSGSNVVTPPALLQGNISLGAGFTLPTYRGFVILVSILVLGLIFLVLRTTNIGRLVRATSSDRDMAALMGVNVPRLYTLVFLAGAALAGLGGALAVPTQSVTPALGNQVILNAFIIAVIGGLGSFGGAFIGAYLVGISIAVGSLIVAGAGQLIPFLAMIAVLLVKPEGLFGGEAA
ncbi:MAG: branched-chain amino acid ABC-type transport system, permease component [uncultured archaeon A07HR60]|nr:MAG: branched-chain amino acid ABC-type transport system, permease component [Halorubrum sp. J07HR59]ESS11176.1 MAG: branched-chain amino acid ABC-type transport system, permease component [uncultured archaeon A07HR60]